MHTTNASAESKTRRHYYPPTLMQSANTERRERACTNACVPELVFEALLVISLPGRRLHMNGHTYKASFACTWALELYTSAVKGRNDFAFAHISTTAYGHPRYFLSLERNSRRDRLLCGGVVQEDCGGAWSGGSSVTKALGGTSVRAFRWQ